MDHPEHELGHGHEPGHGHEHEHVPFPSIESYHKFMHYFARGDGAHVDLVGTVKLHGTNAAIVFHADPSGGAPSFHLQSRNRVVTPASDNAGFAAFSVGLPMADIAEAYRRIAPFETTLILYGEFCGKGIMSNVAVCQLPKMFVVFAVNADGRWHDLREALEWPEYRVYSVLRGGTFEVSLEVPHGAKVPTLRDAGDPPEIRSITDAVERECPFAKTFGVSGVGEGVVWRVRDRIDACFKSKGTKHAGTPKPPRKPTADTTFTCTCTYVVPERTLEQGVEYLVEMGHPVTMESLPAFMRWVKTDVEREDGDLIEASCGCPRDRQETMRALNLRIREWFEARVARRRLST